MLSHYISAEVQKGSINVYFLPHLPILACQLLPVLTLKLVRFLPYSGKGQSPLESTLFLNQK